MAVREEGPAEALPYPLRNVALATEKENGLALIVGVVHLSPSLQDMVMGRGE